MGEKINEPMIGGDPAVRVVFERVAQAGQGHVFRWWGVLDAEARSRLVNQLSSIDFELLERLSRQLRSKQADTLGHLEPPEVIAIPRTEKERRQAEEARRTGEALIRAGKVAAFLVAGGQGTRLGYDGPKGLFPIGPVTGKSLFEMHAEKILAASRTYETPIPWYIMTSETNDAETQAFFAENDFFGLGRDDVVFFRQKMIPALDADGKLILDAKDHVFLNPNGHGGSLLALVEGGAVDDMKARGIEVISYFQVDNVLIKIVDPVFIGHHAQAEAGMSSKMVMKRDAREKVGVFGMVDGKLRVVEYSDMTREDMEARNADGGLTYGAGSIAIHLIDVSFVEAEVRDGFRLPYHVAHKKIPCLNEEGDQILPDVPNGYKFEAFVFDALADAPRSVVMEVAREEEFSPVKNREGEDSPETAKRDLSNAFGRWLEAAGVAVPRTEGGDVDGWIEISPLYADGLEAFVEKAPRHLAFEHSLLIGPE